MFKRSGKIVCVISIIAIFSGCGNNREKFISDTINGCLHTAKVENPEKSCSCLAQYISNQLTDKEINFMYSIKNRIPESLEEMNMNAMIKDKMEKLTNTNRMNGRELKKMKSYLDNCINSK